MSCHGYGCLFTAITTLTKTEVGSRDRNIAVIGLTMLLFEGICTVGLWTRKAVECFKSCLMGHTSRSMEDRSAECDLMKCGAWLQSCQRRRILVCCLDSISVKTALVKNMAPFCPCPKSLPETKLKL